MARPNHRVGKTTAAGVLCFHGDPERPRDGTNIKTLSEEESSAQANVKLKAVLFALFLTVPTV